MFFEITRDEIFRIETPRAWLRWPRVQDAPAIAAFAGRPEVARMTSSWPVGVSAELTAQRIGETLKSNGEGRTLRLAICLKSAPDRVIGQVGLDAGEDGTLELGYHLSPEVWGRGLMTEAVAAIIDMGFRCSSAPAIVAGARTINPASRRVLQKCGFVSTGVGMEQTVRHGEVEMEWFRFDRPAAHLKAVA